MGLYLYIFENCTICLPLNATLKMSWIQTDAKMFKFALSLLVESNDSKKSLRLKGFCPLKPFSTISNLWLNAWVQKRATNRNPIIVLIWDLPFILQQHMYWRNRT